MSPTDPRANWQRVAGLLREAGLSYEVDPLSVQDPPVFITVPELKLKLLVTEEFTNGLQNLGAADGWTYFHVNPTNDLSVALFVQVLVNLRLGVNLLSFTEDQRLEFLCRQIAYLNSEVEELHNELPWKWHRAKGYKKLNEEKALEELVDLVIFCFNFLLGLGYNDAEMLSVVFSKQRKNFERFLPEVAQNRAALGT